MLDVECRCYVHKNVLKEKRDNFGTEFYHLYILSFLNMYFNFYPMLIYN